MIRCLRWLSLPVLLLASACAQLPPRPELPPQVAVAASTGTALDSLIAPLEAAHPGASGFRLLSEGPEAFVIRAQTARLASRSLDVQTYIWHDDVTGLFLAAAVLSAADRGVRVRILLDDMDARAKHYTLAAIDTHPGIEVRLYNPLASRSGTIAMGIEFLGSFSRLNHRMHNKSWIVDNRIAVVGGRNMGNEYFGASARVNFIDLDFAMVGPVVRDASASFDRYWNSLASYPIAALDPESVSPRALERLKAQAAPALEAARRGDYAELLRRDDSVQRMLAGETFLVWSADYQFVTDDPLKARYEEGEERSEVLAAIREELGKAEREVAIVSPYFVPGTAAAESLADGARAGTRVRILTNSLAANDVAAVHGGYAAYRKRLLKGGVELYEMKPQPGAEASSSFRGSSGASLHTKAITVDGQSLFVGSFNLDPRSVQLNTEQGVMVSSPELAAELDAIFDRQVAGDHSWRVTLENGGLRWTDGEEVYDDEPMATPGRRFQAWLARVLGLEPLL